MPSADWYFDFVSPFSYLQCEQLPTLERSIRVRYRPVLFAGLLKAYAHKGPATAPAPATPATPPAASAKPAAKPEPADDDTEGDPEPGE